MSMDPDQATRQTFVDTLMTAFARPADAIGYGYGWHVIGVTQNEDTTEITLETQTPLRGWNETNDPITGPKRVTLTIAPQTDKPAAAALRLGPPQPNSGKWTLDIQNTPGNAGTLLRIYDPRDNLRATQDLNSAHWYDVATRDGHASVLLADSTSPDK